MATLKYTKYTRPLKSVSGTKHCPKLSGGYLLCMTPAYMPCKHGTVTRYTVLLQHTHFAGSVVYRFMCMHSCCHLLRLRQQALGIFLLMKANVNVPHSPGAILGRGHHLCTVWRERQAKYLALVPLQFTTDHYEMRYFAPNCLIGLGSLPLFQVYEMV